MDADALDAAWEKVLEAWDDDETHRKFVALCQSFKRLDFAGSHYREIANDEKDERQPVAKKQIDRILAAAMATLETTKTEPSPAPRRKVMLFALMMATALILIAIWVYTESHG